MRKSLLALLVVLFSSAWAADPNDGNIVRHETKEAAMLADGFHVYDTPRNHEFNKTVLENHDRVVNYLGSTYAGGWVEYGADNKIYQIIAVTRQVKSIDKSVFPSDYYRFVYVKYSIDDLEKVKNKIDEMFLRWYGIGFVKVIGINVKSNKVELSVASDSYQRAYDGLNKLGVNADMVDIKVMDSEIRPLSSYYAGTKLAVRASTGLFNTCTGGFVGSSGIYHVLLTAGHCFAPGFDKVYFGAPYGGVGELIGNLLAYVNGGLYGKDYGAFSNFNFVHTIWPGIAAPPSGVKSVKSPVDVGYSMIGRRVCGYGVVSGWGCSSIRMVNQTITTKYGVRLINFASFERCSFPGDSGGPIILETGNNAVGLISADECASFGGGGYPQTWFQPIKPVIQELPDFVLWTN